jgi:glycosyltransferase involved in cell wall biosynthesis
MRILALTKYGDLAASTRQRFVQYEPALAAAGFSVDYAPLLGNDHLERLVAGRRASPVGVLRAYLGRLIRLAGARRYDVLWVHCELFPYFPGILERLGGIWGKPIVFDYDDAIFHMYDASPNPLVRGLLAGKLAPLLRSASACCCGNSYLCEYAARHCRRCIVLPTVVDTDGYRPAPRRAEGGGVTIGWIGSPSTWPNVRPILPVLADLHRKHGIRFRAIGAGASAERDRFEGMEHADWSEATEIAEVQAMDIGIMPLLDLPFERGKSGYKLVQYMACGLPVVASPVGVNREMVTSGENGFLATSEREWSDALEQLVLDPALRARMGEEGRERAVERYSLSSQAPRLIEIFRSAVEGR